MDIVKLAIELDRCRDHLRELSDALCRLGDAGGKPHTATPVSWCSNIDVWLDDFELAHFGSPKT